MLPVPQESVSLSRLPLTALFILALIIPHSAMSATPNPGDPLFCQPDEGATFLIVNGTTGVFTTNNDCYSPASHVNNNNVTVQPTHGTLTSDGAGNYVYVTTDPNYTGLDTFTVQVERSVGYGPGSPGSFAGGAGTIPMTFNVLPSTLTATKGFGTAVVIPVPPGAVSPCPATYGCVTGATFGSVLPAHGNLVFSGLTATYTPANGYSGTDTFAIRALGINHDGTSALNSGNIMVTVTVGSAPASGVPVLGTWGLIALAGLLLIAGCRWMHTRAA